MHGNAGAQVQITEFMADNETTLRDDFGDYPDWIELWNSSTNTVNLLDWALTDSTKKMREWVFPSTNLPPNACLSHPGVTGAHRGRHCTRISNWILAANTWR